MNTILLPPSPSPYMSSIPSGACARTSLGNYIRFVHAYWAQFSACVAALFAAWIAIRYASQPLIEAFGFRQTQTALTSFWMIKEGWQMAYQTPVAGYPWSIPFEFPIYQSIAALIAWTYGFNLDPVGRLLSFAFLLACAWPAFAIIRRLALSNQVAWIFCALLWSSPLYLLYGRTFMIETAALFFTLAAMVYALDLRGQSPCWTSALIFSLFGALGMLQKVTTAAPVLVVMGFFLIGAYIRDHGHTLPSWRQLSCMVVAFAPPFFLAYLWNSYADSVKIHNSFGAQLTSKSLINWNFGSLAQRMDPHVWKTIIWDRVLVNNAAGLFGVALVSATLIWGDRRVRGPMLLCLLLFLLPLAIFTNLHYVHNYYQASCASFLVAALAMGCTYLFSQTRHSKTLPLVLTLALMSFNFYRFETGYGKAVRKRIDIQLRRLCIIS